jgi:hypothetical protein
MTIDSGGAAQRPESPDLWRLPDVLEVRVRRRRFDPPRRVTSAGVDREVSDAVEIEIHVSEPFQIRALGPVLWVGSEPLTIAEGDGKDVYRFFSFQPDGLQAEAPIALAWNSPGAPRKETPHRYAPPTQ